MEQNKGYGYVMVVLELSGIGQGQIYTVGVLLGAVTLFSIVFVKYGFQIGIMLSTRNGDENAEPSELQYMSWYVGWGFCTLLVIVLAVAGTFLVE